MNEIAFLMFTLCGQPVLLFADYGLGEPSAVYGIGNIPTAKRDEMLEIVKAAVAAGNATLAVHEIEPQVKGAVACGTRT